MATRTPQQLQSILDRVYREENHTPRDMTESDAKKIDTLLNYRYAPVLENTGPYRKFVMAYLIALATGAPQKVIDVSYNVMRHAVSEMRRAYKAQR